MTGAGAAFGPDRVATAAAAVRARCRVVQPTVAIVLGSGLGGFARHIEGATRVSFDDLAGLPRPSVSGHTGELVHGVVQGREVVVIAGRLHLYEGHAPDLVVMPVRIAHALGARTLVTSNAAGGIRADLAPGTLMIIRDHINLMWRNPLIGPAAQGDTRFPDMSAPYDAELRSAFRTAVLDAGAMVAEGVYAGVLGPSYETPAEIRMLADMGADAVGMSTIPEVLVARAIGMRVLAVSCITNAAAGTSPIRLSHADVLATAARVEPVFERALKAWLASPQVASDG